MSISINPKPTIYRNLYENTGSALCRLTHGELTILLDQPDYE